MDTVKPTGIVSYCRVSTEKQSTAEHSSLEAQLNIIRNYAAYRRISILSEYSECISGSKPWNQRPELKRLLEEISPNTLLVVANMSRLTRSVKDILNIIEILDSKKCYFLELSTGVDTMSQHNRLIINILTSFNQFEREQSNSRTKKVMNYLSEEGKLKPKPPYGYKFVGKRQPYQEVPEEQECINYMKTLVRKNPTITLSQLREKIIDKGFKPPGKSKSWYIQGIRNICERENIPLELFKKDQDKIVQIKPLLQESEEKVINLEGIEYYGDCIKYIKTIVDKNPKITLNQLISILNNKNIPCSSGRKPIWNYTKLRKLCTDNGIEIQTLRPEKKDILD